MIGSQFIVGTFGGSVPSIAPQAAAPATAPSARFVTAPAWTNGNRSFEAGETHRLNKAHWQKAQDFDINRWLVEQLNTIRGRAIYESRNNGVLSGMVQTLADDVVGQDGPTLQCLSSDEEYNKAHENLWRSWFRAPTFRPNFSGAALLKMWVRNLPRCGEFLATIGTDERAEGPVKLRLRPRAARWLSSPYGESGNTRLILGIEHDANDAPTRYWFADPQGSYYLSPAGGVRHSPYPPDLVIHEFVIEEEGQARGYPWFTPSLQPTADLRDYDTDVQNASRRHAQSTGMLYTTRDDAPTWVAPESTTLEPGVIEMAPPGWQPSFSPAVQPAAQYPDYRAERQREIGAPIGMPLMIVRMDASKHNYSSARFDGQTYDQRVRSIQSWLSGTQNSQGTLSRLADLIAAEARFQIPALRRRPDDLIYEWTWHRRPHVDPTKGADADATDLETRAETFIDILAARGTNLEAWQRKQDRVNRVFAAMPNPPEWWTGPAVVSAAPARAARTAAAKEEPVNA